MLWSISAMHDHGHGYHHAPMRLQHTCLVVCAPLGKGFSEQFICIILGWMSVPCMWAYSVWGRLCCGSAFHQASHFGAAVGVVLLLHCVLAGRQRRMCTAGRPALKQLIGICIFFPCMWISLCVFSVTLSRAPSAPQWM